VYDVRRPFLLSLLGSVLVAGSAFLPWLRIGDIGLAGVPDPAGLFVLGLGLLGLLLSAVSLLTPRDSRQALVLIGLAGLTTLLVVWQTGPTTVADRALARAQAVALVDNLPVEPVPPITVGAGLLLGLIGAATVAGVGLAGAVSSPRS
jgi:hypothetical protein